ncbi:MAG: hypothetical protein ABI743_08705, partial [bacterium]
MRSQITRPALAASFASLFLAGCSHSSLVTPAGTLASDPTDSFTPAGVVVREGGTVEAPIGRGLLTMDAVNMTASWEPLLSRGAQDNNAVYALGVNEFLKPIHLQIKSFRRVDEGYEIDYEFIHPFRSSEVSNRADLGFSGMFMLGITVSGATNYTWFKGDPNELIADPRWILNADGYYQPKGLIDTTGIVANAFPYQLLIDESDTGNRKDSVTGAPISNGGSPTGNFTAPAGWQTGGSSTWTGYGVIHQGQKVRNTIIISGVQLSAVGSLPVITVLLAKYNDPRSGVPGLFHRLPSVPPDVLGGFGYRMPHGAFDSIQGTYAGASDGWLS